MNKKWLWLRETKSFTWMLATVIREVPFKSIMIIPFVLLLAIVWIFTSYKFRAKHKILYPFDKVDIVELQLLYELTTKIRKAKFNCTITPAGADADIFSGEDGAIESIIIEVFRKHNVRKILSNIISNGKYLTGEYLTITLVDGDIKIHPTVINYYPDNQPRTQLIPLADINYIENVIHTIKTFLPDTENKHHFLQ